MNFYTTVLRKRLNPDARITESYEYPKNIFEARN